MVRSEGYGLAERPKDRMRNTIVMVAGVLFAAGPLAAQASLENQVAYSTSSVRLRAGPSTEHEVGG